MVYVLYYEKDGKDMIYTTDQFKSIQIIIDEFLSDGVSFLVDCLHEHEIIEEK